MSFPRYPNYKASGAEWLGEVPVHWEVKRLRYLSTIRKGRLPVETFPSPMADSDLPYLSMEFLRGESDNPNYVPAFPNLLRAESGDILLLWDGSNAGEFLRAKQGVVSSTVALIEGRNIEKEFLFFACKALERRIKDQTVGMGIPHVSGGELRSYSIPCPDHAEQIHIAAFLERETAKIDGLVAEQRRLMELLKEKRQAVLSRAVTQGLNPHAPMKPSGIEWLGDVPEHWEVKRLSPLSTKITNGYVGPTRDILKDKGVRYLQSLHIKGNEIRFDSPYFVSEEWSNQHSKSILETGDVLIVQTGDIGQVTVVTEEFAGCNCHALIIVAPVRLVVDGEWISWILNSDYGFHSLLSIQTGALHPHLNCGDVKDISIPLPPIAEQRNIIAYIVEQVRAFDTLTAEAQRAIDLLQERRNALISAAVTGQIDVRGLGVSSAVSHEATCV